MMKSNSVIIFFVLMSVMSTTWADDDVTSSTEKSSHRNWHFNANIAYTSRTLSGTIANQTGITDNVFGDLVATGDAMNGVWFSPSYGQAHGRNCADVLALEWATGSVD
ncbi:MAG: hypothetical protein WBO93_10705 [Gammaproteobacteria bacterium]